MPAKKAPSYTDIGSKVSTLFNSTSMQTCAKAIRKKHMDFLCTEEDLFNHFRISSYSTVQNGKHIVQIAPRILHSDIAKQINLKTIDRFIGEYFTKLNPDRKKIEIRIQNLQFVNSANELNVTSLQSSATSVPATAAAAACAVTISDEHKLRNLLQNERRSEAFLPLFASSLQAGQSPIAILITDYLYGNILNHQGKIIANLRPAAITSLQLEIYEQYKQLLAEVSAKVDDTRKQFEEIKNLFSLQVFNISPDLDRYLATNSLTTTQYKKLQQIALAYKTNLTYFINLKCNIIPKYEQLNVYLCDIYSKLENLIDCQLQGNDIPGLGTSLTKSKLKDTQAQTKEHLDRKISELKSRLVIIPTMEILSDFCEHVLQALSSAHHAKLLDEQDQWHKKQMADFILRVTPVEADARTRLVKVESINFEKLLCDYQRRLRDITNPIVSSQHIEITASSVSRVVITSKKASKAIKAEQEAAAAAASQLSDDETSINTQDVFSVNLDVRGTAHILDLGHNMHRIGDLQNIFITDLGQDEIDIITPALRGFISRSSLGENGLKQHYPEWIALKNCGNENRYIFVKFEVENKQIYLPYRNYSHDDYVDLISRHKEKPTLRHDFLHQALIQLDVRVVIDHAARAEIS